MQLDAVLKSLEATSVATAISEHDALFPWIESLHVLAITLVVGSIWIVTCGSWESARAIAR